MTSTRLGLTLTTAVPGGLVADEPIVAEHRNGKRKLNYARLGLVVGVLIAAGGCGSTKSCKQGTLLVTVTFDGTTSAADDVEVDVTIAGGSLKRTTLAHKSGTTNGSIEFDFPGSYPVGERVDVTVVAQKAGATLGTATATVQALPAGCGALALTVSAADGGAGGSGAAGHAGSGGTAAGGFGGTARGGAGGGAGTGGNGTGGVAGTGGTGTGGSAAGGSGGTARGGAGGAAGAGGAGGVAGTGGTGTGGSAGTGGVIGACQGTETQCSANGLQTCMDGQWGTATVCGTRQTCTGAVGSAKCSCTVDPLCSVVGNACADTSTLAACAQDAQGCFYESTSSTCTNGACSGPAGAASCCANVCATGTTQCLSGATLQTCAVAGTGCTALATSACSSGLLCERVAPAACVDPTWAEWPMPNGPVDVAAGAPNPEAYTDNGDQTITDNVTELMWQKAVPTGTYTWAQAVAYCPTLTLGGHSDWRLPSRIELVSIVDAGLSNPSINGTYFPATPANYFWSSSPGTGSPSSAWLVSFYDGFANTYDMTGTGDVRCVR